MKTIWQVRRAAFAHALGVITLAPRARRHKESVRPFGFQCWRSIGAAMLLGGAVLMSSFGTAHALVTTSTMLMSSVNPAQPNQSITFTATVTGSGGTPTGMVQFIDLSNATILGNVPLSGGVATITTSFPGGNRDIRATYGGDSIFATSQSNTITEVIQNGTTSMTQLMSSVNPSQVNQSVTFTATVTGSGGTPTGTVTFDLDVGGTIQTVNLVNGQAMFTTSFAAVSTHTIFATYNGDGTFAGSTSNTINQVVQNGTTSMTHLSSSPNPSQVNQSVTFTATVTGSGGTPTGTVNFVDLSNASPIGTATLSGGVATITTSFTGSPHNIEATYNGDGTFASSQSNIVAQVVQSGATTTTNLSSSPNPSQINQSVTFTATVSGSGGTPTGTVNFIDLSSATPIGGVTLSGGVATITTSFSLAGTHNIQATYSGDGTFAGGQSNVVAQMVQTAAATNTTVTSSPNPSATGQGVSFTATVKPASGSGTPTGTVAFQDGSTTLGTVTLSTVGGVQTATFTTSTLIAGSHSITAVYSGDATFNGSTSAMLTQNVSNSTSDSIKLRQMQVSATPAITAAWGATTASAMDDAVSAGFGGNPQSLSPAGTGFTYYFNDDAPTQQSAATDEDSLRRYLASPNGSLTSPSGSANSAASDSVKRVDDEFRTLGYAGGMPTKAPPPPSSTPHDWLAWVTVRGTDYWRGTVGSDLKGDQVDVLAGLTRRISPTLVVGAFGGYEHFDYSSQAFNGVLKGDGWTVGAYLGWKLAPNLRFDAGGAWSDIMANDTAGTASGNFTGTRWLINGGLTGTYPWQQLIFEPSARVFAVWEHENAFTDSLGTFQPARNFETGRASAGVKAIYPLAWTTSTVALSPYAGLYADYYFSRDDAQTAGLTTIPLLQGFSARATGGVAASFAGGAILGAGGEFGGIGSATHIWTWTARGKIPF